MNLEDRTLSNISRPQRDKSCLISPKVPEVVRLTGTESRMVTRDQGEQLELLMDTVAGLQDEYVLGVQCAT